MKYRFLLIDNKLYHICNNFAILFCNIFIRIFSIFEIWCFSHLTTKLMVALRRRRRNRCQEMLPQMMSEMSECYAVVNTKYCEMFTCGKISQILNIFNIFEVLTVVTPASSKQSVEHDHTMRFGEFNIQLIIQITFTSL